MSISDGNSSNFYELLYGSARNKQSLKLAQTFSHPYFGTTVAKCLKPREINTKTSLLIQKLFLFGSELSESGGQENICLQPLVQNSLNSV